MSDDKDKLVSNSGKDEAGNGLVLPGDDGFDAQAELLDDEAGLEVDDRQKEEIRRIFGTSFPQYLQPVEEIISQLIAGDGDPESEDALSGMLSSLMEAAERMGFDAVHKLVGELRSMVAMLKGVNGETVDPELRDDIDTVLEQLKAMAREMSGETPDDPKSRGVSSQTVVAALKNREGVGNVVLKRLSAAGLVTVDQLLMARPDEIAAVAGLDIDIVHTILGYLKPKAPPAKEAVPSTDKGGAPVNTVDALHQEILEKLRQEAELETSLENLKAEVRSIRSTVLSRRAELDSLGISMDEKLSAYSAFNEHLADQNRLLDEFGSRRNALYRKYASTEEAVQKKEMKLAILRKERRSLERETVDLSRTVGGLIDKVQTVRRAFAKRRRSE